MNMMKKMYDEGDDTMKKVPRVTHTAVAPPFCPAHPPPCRPSAKQCSSREWEAVPAPQEVIFRVKRLHCDHRRPPAPKAGVL